MTQITAESVIERMETILATGGDGVAGAGRAALGP